MDFTCWMNLAGRRLEAGLGILLELQFVESYWVCYCIPNFPCKCGWHLKESHKSVIQKASSAVAESVKTLGIVLRNGASPLIPEAWSQGLASEPLSLVTYRLSIFRQASKWPKLPHLCNMNYSSAFWLVGWVKQDSLIHLVIVYWILQALF